MQRSGRGDLAPGQSPRVRGRCYSPGQTTPARPGEGSAILRLGTTAMPSDNPGANVERATRKPMLLLRFVGWSLLRYAARTFLRLL